MNTLALVVWLALVPAAPSPGADAVWFVEIAGAQQGPMTVAAVKALQTEGKLKPTNLVWKAGMPGWVALSTVPELLVAQPPPLPPESARPPPLPPADAVPAEAPADPPAGPMTPTGPPLEPFNQAELDQASLLRTVAIAPGAVAALLLLGSVASGAVAFRLNDGRYSPGLLGLAGCSLCCGGVFAVIAAALYSSQDNRVRELTMRRDEHERRRKVGEAAMKY